MMRLIAPLNPLPMRSIRLSIAALLLLLAACVPAQVPPQLAHTPGPPITITEDTITTDVFTVRYPRGWRVVKLSVAGAPPWLAFISEDDTLRIEVRAEPFDDETVPLLEETVVESGVRVYLRAMADEGDETALREWFEIVRESVVMG